MRNSFKVMASMSAFCVGVVAMPMAAAAGPCSDQIAELGRKLSQSPSLGPVTTGTLTGSNPNNAPGTSKTAGTPPSSTGTSAGNRVGGTAGTKELNAAVGNTVATSTQDVRRQQEGLPTAAAVAAAGSGKSVETTPGHASGPGPNDRMSEAKAELEKARMMDQKGDGACRGAIDKARQLAG